MIFQQQKNHLGMENVDEEDALNKSL